MSHSPHLITHGRRGLLHAGFGREIQRKTQNRQLAAFAFYSQTLSNDLARAGEQQGSAEVLLYQGRQVATDSTEVKSSNDFNKQISNSGYNGSTDQTMINTSQVDMTDSTQVVQALVHENARRDMARGGVGATLDATDQTTLASTRGQRGAETFTAYAELNGESTKGDSAKGAGTQSQWNAANANSETIKTGNAVVAKMNSKEVKPWLGDEQKVQMAKEMSAAKGVDKLAVLVKWGTTSVKQDALTTMGVGKGLKEAGINDIKGVVEFLKDPIKGLDGLAQLVNSPEMREKLGAEMLNSLNTRIESMKTALKQGGDQNAEQLGKDLGNLIWQAGSVVTTVGGVAAGGAKLAKMGVKLGDKTLESMKAANAAAKAEEKAINAAKVENNVYGDGTNPPDWTIGKPGEAQLNLATHWEKHKTDFLNLQSPNDFYRATQNFVNNPPAGTLTKTASNGDVLLYDASSNTFAVKAIDGTPRTMFKPDPSAHGFTSNLDFWNSK